MKKSPDIRRRPEPATGVRFDAKRIWPAGMIHAILQPSHAKAASVNDRAVRLTFGSLVTEISLGDVESAEVIGGLCHFSVRIEHVAGRSHVSGLSRKAAHGLADAIEAKRREWWQQALPSDAKALRSLHERLAVLSDPPKYVSLDAIEELVVQARALAGGCGASRPKDLLDCQEFRMLGDILEFLKAPEAAQAEANKVFVDNELMRSRNFFDRIEARPLSAEQRRAVVVDERRNLVVAAAGSGKTSVIVAKAGWLVQRGFRKPSELLLLAFARDARAELEERLKERLGVEIARDLTVRTFHSLGLEIVGEAEGKRPSLSVVAEDSRKLFDLIKRITADLLGDRKASAALRDWFQAGFAPSRNEHDFNSLGEYYGYLRSHDIRSLKGDKVRSFEECEIANFLHLNGVDYQYEAPYAHDLSTSRRRQYKPDFHLPRHDIYIEHFGINLAGDPAPFIDGKQYREEMRWKRDVHKRHRTRLIETYSHENEDGRLLEKLEEKLAAHGVALSPIPSEKVFAILKEQGRIDPFTRLVATFLQHFKGGRLSFADLGRRVAAGRDGKRGEAFIAAFRQICDRYEEELRRAGEIDFHDMINRATDHVEAGRYRSSFGYILVDEFQDISPSRARLLKALLANSPHSQQFSVGDDWQAIYRFAGSDIEVMRKFGEHFGGFERIDLATTFRLPESVASIASGFVLRNQAQIRKDVRSASGETGPAVVVGFPGSESTSLLKEALDRVADHASRYEDTSEVLLLGRYWHLKPRGVSALSKRYPGLRFNWTTVHGSKGLEAHYVVVLGMCSGKYGFPSEIDDDPLLDLVLAAPEDHPNAEERRLFYVALTRAKRQVLLLAEGGPRSKFVDELLEDGYDIEVFGHPPRDEVSCPACGSGRLDRKANSRDGNFFYGCSNYPHCEFTVPSCPNCGSGLPVKQGESFGCPECGMDFKPCPNCGGRLLIRKGKHGSFMGCSNFPRCGFTRSMRSAREKRRFPSDARRRPPGARRRS